MEDEGSCQLENCLALCIAAEVITLVLREARRLLEVTCPLNWGLGLMSSYKLSPHSDLPKNPRWNTPGNRCNR